MRLPGGARRTRDEHEQPNGERDDSPSLHVFDPLHVRRYRSHFPVEALNTDLFVVSR
jgi:hypothetical protein